MAELEKPVLPPFLYRFRKVTNGQSQKEVEALNERYLWCAAYKDMNDPMEGFYSPTARLEKQTDFTRARDQIFNAKQDVGICCFSDTHDNELMWTHYAKIIRGYVSVIGRGLC